MKLIRRVIFYLTLSVSVVFIALVVSAFLYKDRLINQFIKEANKQLNTPITIKKMDVSVFQQFPRLSIVFHDVYVEDSHPGQYPLLTAKKISFQLNPLEVWGGNYTVKGMEIHDSETNLKINQDGLNNYSIIKKQTGSGNHPSTIAFALSNVSIHNAVVHYLDLRILQDFTFKSDNLVASIHTAKDIYDIDAEGQLTAEKMMIGSNNYLNGKSFEIESHLIYDDDKKHMTIQPSDIALKSSSFSVSGTYGWKEKNIINIATRGTDTDIQTLLSLLPESKGKKFDKYRSKGNVYFEAQLNGEISAASSPALSIDFGFRDATLFHPDYKTRIENATLTGSFSTTDVNNLERASLALKNITGKLNNENFQANFVLQNFSDPEIILDFKGKLDARSVLDFYPVEDFNYVSGSLLVDIAFEGKVNLLKNKNTAQRVSTLGTVDMEGVNLLYGKNNIPLENLQGNLQFNNNDLALSNVTGKLGDSDFLLNGFFKNIITFLLFEDQPIGIETDLKARFIDLNQLFALGFGSSEDADETDEYTFNLSRNVNFNFNCDIKSLRYKRFHGQAIRGDLLVKNQMAVSRNLSLKTMGGNLNLSGIVDAKNNKAIDVVSTLKLNGINPDSVFYVFENFNQTFIQDKHLKGKATADVNLEMTLNQNLRLFRETLIADISIAIASGELNNFEPLKKLERYLGDEGLNRLRFSELKNDIHIENKNIYLPQMEVRSNVTDIRISGTHTFDQRIDYRLITPLRRKRVVEVEAKEALEEDAQGNSRLFLKITGTTDDYRIAYDTEAVKKKIASDLKKEVQELKDAFKSKGKKKEKEVELSKEDYFDW
ncbi:MAG: AsmA-like C-terminal region-containing protein [Cyclobacteriaceae bacterium]